MASFFNARNVKSNRKLLLPFFHITQNASNSPFISKPPATLYSIITRNVVWQHNALRRIAEKKQRMKGRATKEKNQIDKKKVYERSGLKTSKLKEMFSKKKEETPTK